MPDEYPLYDAKAKLSALVREVREGRSFVITVHGKPVAELRPYEPPPKAQTLAERIAELTAKGLITPSRLVPGETGSLRVGPHIPGALQRFLDDRD
jgi:prevent-host-death family protein